MMKKMFIALVILALFTGTALTQSTPLSIVTAKATKDSGGNLSITWTTNVVATIKAKIVFASEVPNPFDKSVIESSIPSTTQHSINIAASEIPSNFASINIAYIFSFDEATSIRIFKSEITTETTPPINGTSQTINLKQGFNFISFTVNPDTTPSALAQNNSALIDDIYLFSSAAGSFLSLSEGTLTALGAGKGYIIKSKADGSITISGTPVTTIGNISLKNGFNLIGISKAVSANTFSNLMKNFSTIKGLYKWSAAAGSFIQVVLDSSGLPQLIDGVDPQPKAGESYFMNVVSDTYMNYDGGLITIGSQSPITQTVSPPIFSLGTGTYSSVQSITINSITSGATIKYTTDGSMPSATNGMLYSGIITVLQNMTINAIAIKDGFVNSAISSVTYTIIASSQSSIVITGTLPALSAPKDGPGYMVNYGTNYEMGVFNFATMTEITGSSVVINGSSYTATVPAGAVSVTALVAIKHKTTGKITNSALAGILPTAAAMSAASVSKITISGVNLTAESMALATIAKDKAIVVPSVPVSSSVTRCPQA